MQLPARILVPLERFSQHISSKFKVMESFTLDKAKMMGTQVIPFDIYILWKSKAPSMPPPNRSVSFWQQYAGVLINSSHK
jgi:hypothetical protein